MNLLKSKRIVPDSLTGALTCPMVGVPSKVNEGVCITKVLAEDVLEFFSKEVMILAEGVLLLWWGGG